MEEVRQDPGTPSRICTKEYKNSLGEEKREFLGDRQQQSRWSPAAATDTQTKTTTWALRSTLETDPDSLDWFEALKYCFQWFIPEEMSAPLGITLEHIPSRDQLQTSGTRSPQSEVTLRRWWIGPQ